MRISFRDYSPVLAVAADSGGEGSARMEATLETCIAACTGSI